MATIAEKKQLRAEFKIEHGINWKNSQGEPDFEYVWWLENNLLDKSHNKDYAKLPSNKTLREFVDDYNVCSDEFGGDDALNMVKDALSEYGNFA